MEITEFKQIMDNSTVRIIGSKNGNCIFLFNTPSPKTSNNQRLGSAFDDLDPRLSLPPRRAISSLFTVLKKPYCLSVAW